DSAPPRERLGERRACVLRHERSRIDARHAVPPGDLGGALTDVENVSALVEYRPRYRHGIAKTDESADRAEPKAFTLHDRSVELDRAVLGERRPKTGVESRIVFHRSHGAFD